MKICKDCKYFDKSRLLSADYAECTREVRVDRVTGKKEYYFCSTQRRYPGVGCGPNGDWFEPIKVEIDVTPKQSTHKALPAPVVEDAKYPSWKDKVVKWFKK